MQPEKHLTYIQIIDARIWAISDKKSEHAFLWKHVKLYLGTWKTEITKFIIKKKVATYIAAEHVKAK